MEKELEESLDRSIDHHYQDICFNPNKKDTLRRLTQQSRLYNQTIDQSIHTKQPLSLEVDNNHSINLYIQHVYHKYHLEDPLNKCYRNRQTEDTRDVTLINTPFKQTEKIQETTKTTKSQKITSTKKKLLEMRQNYKKDCSDVISSVFFPAQLTHRETEGNGMRQSRIAKQIGYRTRQRIHFKTHTNEDISSFQSTFQLELPIKTVRTSNLKVRFNYNPQQQQKTRRQRAVSEVQVSFRYCPMCEEVILHENIAYHQTNCKQIQEAYKLPLNQLQKEITAKIHRMKNEVEGELQSYTDQKILKEYHNLSRSLMLWLNKQDEQSFEKVRGGYQQMALRQFDLIAKLRWFQNLHQTIRREIKSTSI